MMGANTMTPWIGFPMYKAPEIPPPTTPPHACVNMENNAFPNSFSRVPPRRAMAASRSGAKQADPTMAQDSAVNPTVLAIGWPLYMAVPMPAKPPIKPAAATRALTRSKSSMLLIGSLPAWMVLSSLLSLFGGVLQFGETTVDK